MFFVSGSDPRTHTDSLGLTLTHIDALRRTLTHTESLWVTKTHTRAQHTHPKSATDKNAGAQGSGPTTQARRYTDSL